MMQISAVVRPAAVGAIVVAIGLYAEWAYSRTGAAPFQLARDLGVGWTFAGAGLVARWRRPGSRTGLLMIIEGLTWFIGNLQGTALPALVAVGAWLEGLSDAVLVHLVLSFPSGRLETRSARLVVAAAYTVVVAVGLLWAMSFDPRTDGWATYLSCPGCGPNAMLVDPDPALFATIDLTYRCLGATLGAACAALVARRCMTGSSRTRQALLPTWTFVVVGAVLVGWALLTLDPGMSGAPGQPMLWVADLSQLAVPIALLWWLLRTGQQQATDPRSEPFLLEERRLLDAVRNTISTLSTLQRIDPGPATDTTVRAMMAWASEELQLAIFELEELRRRAAVADTPTQSGAGRSVRLRPVRTSRCLFDHVNSN